MRVRSRASSSNLPAAEGTRTRLLAGLPLALFALLLLPVAGSAHASVVAFEPGPGVFGTPPTTVGLAFSEPVTPAGRGIAVWSPSGRQVGGRVRQPAPSRLTVDVEAAERGTYIVTWSVIASDTHPSRGTLTFSVGAAGPQPLSGGLPAGDVGAVSPIGLLLQAAGRWLHLAGFALAFGALAFARVMLHRSDSAAEERAVRNVALLGILLLLAAEPVALLGQVLSFGSLDGQVTADILASPAGRIIALRLGAALLLWALLGAAAGPLRRRGWNAAIALGLALAIADASASHAVAGAPAVLGALLNAVHELAMATWLGGFAALVAIRAAGLPNDPRALVVGFGRLAGVALACLFLSGALLAVAHLRSPSDVLGSSYGAVLAIKVLAAGAAALAALFGLRKGHSWRLEAGAMAGVLALAGLLVSLPPPR